MQPQNLFINILGIRYYARRGVPVLLFYKPQEIPVPGADTGEALPTSAQGDAGVSCPNTPPPRELGS